MNSESKDPIESTGTIGPDHQLPAPRRNTGVRITVWVVVLLVFAVAFYLVWTHKSDPTKSVAPRRGAGGTVTLNTATAKKGDIGIYQDAIGTVTPVYTASITSQVSGIITAVNYREGQIVSKGDLLIEIDSRPYRATLLQAQGTLERDENILAQAKMDLGRYKDAWARNAIPKQTLDDQEKLVLQDEGTVKIDQGAVQYDQIEVDYCRIVAPISGRVGLRLVDPGNVVQSSGDTTLAVITQLQPTTVIFTVPEDSLSQISPRLRQRTRLSVTAFDRSGQEQLGEGTLISLDNQIDTTTGTVKARASFANKDNRLFPNQFVNARLLIDTLHNATLIPTSAIQHNGTNSFVYVIQDRASSPGKVGGPEPVASGSANQAGKANVPTKIALMRAIKPGVVDGDTTQVTGIEPGDVVADSSFDKLQDKAPVLISSKPLPSSSATSGSSAP